MRYSKTHKEETRRKLLDSSRALVKKGGFGSTGVDALMSAIGMTAGAFYSHFPSKQALLREVVREEMAHSIALLHPDSDASGQQARKTVRMYLDPAHARHPEAGCVLPAMGAELARVDPQVRATIESGLKHMHAAWREVLGDDDAAWSVMAQLVGALVLARTVKSEAARKRILEANRRHVERLLDGVEPELP